MASALVIKDLTKTYANGTAALKGVSLEIPEGDFYALLGPNGAGKTTIIGIVTGLVTKTSGNVSVFGADIETESELARTYIGVVPQELNFNVFEKVIDVVVTQAGYYGIPRSVAYPRAEKILDGLGLSDKKLSVSNTLSGGMKRRLLIARALIHEPRFLVLDEPTAGVDVELRRGMWEFLKTLTANGTTILLTTHYLEEAEQLAKYVAIINKGEIIAKGTIKSVLENLHTETLVLDLAKPVTDHALQSLAAYHPKKSDADTLEIEIGQTERVSDAVEILTHLGLPVKTIHGKSGRLEEVFLHLTNAK
jgi:ABC-2 type transport system ATP-binding protein